MLKLLKKKIKLTVPLSEISYHEPDTGISFYWNQLQVLIPYHRLPLKVAQGSLIDEFKTFLEGKGSIALYLECHRLTFYIEITDVIVKKRVIDRFNDFTSMIDNIVKKIDALIEQNSLNLEKTQIILYQYGFQLDDGKVNRILTKIVNSLPPRKVVEKLPFPLSNLSYHSRGVRFFDKDTQFEVEKNKLPVEVGPALEKIKGNFIGNITFLIETSYLQQWDIRQGQLRVGQASREIKDIEMSSNIPRVFKSMRNQFIIDSIRGFIDNSSISLETVKTLLEDWGLGLPHQETALEVIAAISPWTKEKNVKVALKDLTYHDDGIAVPVDNHQIRIPAKSLPFGTHQRLENIKSALEGHIGIHVYQPFQFTWDEEKEQLDITEKKSVKIKINMDEETSQKYKKFYWWYIEKGMDINADGTIPEPGEFPAGPSTRGEEVGTAAENAAAPGVHGVPGMPEVPGGQVEKTGTAETRSREEKNNREIELIPDLPTLINTVPLSQLENQKYNPGCIRILEGMANQIYMTTRDLWFRVGDRLIWERSEPGSATYIFRWPEEDLGFFVGKIWVSTLEEIRKDKENTGYIAKVSHIPRDIPQWEDKIKQALKKP